jgi:hypothetical protein
MARTVNCVCAGGDPVKTQLNNLGFGGSLLFTPRLKIPVADPAAAGYDSAVGTDIGSETDLRGVGKDDDLAKEPTKKKKERRRAGSPKSTAAVESETENLFGTVSGEWDTAHLRLMLRLGSLVE